MIIIRGSVETTDDNLQEVMALSLEHVRRSRAEAGCLRHDAHIDAEHPQRIVFYEEWQDMAAVQAHFAVPASRSFVESLAALASAPPDMQMFEATRIR